MVDWKVEWSVKMKEQNWVGMMVVVLVFLWAVHLVEKWAEG